jgi:hypothetical protein
VECRHRHSFHEVLAHGQVRCGPDNLVSEIRTKPLRTAKTAIERTLQRYADQ